MDNTNQPQQNWNLHDAAVSVEEIHLPAEVRRNRIAAPSLSDPSRRLDVPVEVITLPQDLLMVARDAPVDKENPPKVVANKESGSSGTEDEKALFFRELKSFYHQNNMELKTKMFYGHPLDLYTIWKMVMDLGGYEKVSETKSWRQVGHSFHPPSSCTAVSAIFREYYEKTLLEFEKYKRQKGDLQRPSADPAQQSSSKVGTGKCQASGSGCAPRDAAAGTMQIKQAGSSKPAGNGAQNGVMRLITDLGSASDWVKISVQQSRDGYDIHALVAGLHEDEVKVESDFHGRVIITGIPGDLDNPWGIKPFLKVISLPSKIDPALTQATFRQHGILEVSVHRPRVP